MGVVYTARAAKLGRVVALKFLPPQWSHDDNAKQRFLREAQAASATNHPNICTIHDIETAGDGQLFIVMAYYESQTLKQRLESGPLPVEQALDLATQVADGLAKAHAQGVVHRDIKPGNLIVTDEGVRILDFGLATFADALKLTAENVAVGTIAYMSPEQVRGLAVDARTDVWAVGAVLYEMLTGHPPFRGSHAEAIGFAIRNEVPAPIRSQRPEVPEEVEQVVFRALHKEAPVRFATARELSRALRQVRGLTVPLDLRTEPVVAHDPRPRIAGRRVVWSAAVAAVATVGALTWSLWPVDRTSVAIVPVVNLTGYEELEPYRLALTHAISTGLAESRVIRAIPHDQMAVISKPYRIAGRDISSGEARRAIAANTDAPVMVVVAIVNEGGGFKGRVEFRNARTSTNEGSFETAPEVSTLVKEAAYQLVPSIVNGIEAHFMPTLSRAHTADVLYSAVGRRRAARLPARTLEAARAFEQGLDAFEELEYAASSMAFATAAKLDPFNPTVMAWRSRTARLMRRDADGEELARQALTLLTAETPATDRLFVEAVAAESRRDAQTASARYMALIERHSDEPVWRGELAGFQDRQGLNAAAIDSYHAVLDRDSQLVRPHLELCRLYNRINQAANAREHGRRSLDGYMSLGADGGRVQALMCLADSLRVGSDRERAEALRHAEDALAITKRLDFQYNLPRAYNYVALALDAQESPDRAAEMWTQSLSAARAAGNTVIQPLVLMNLGHAHQELGNRVAAIEFYQQSAQAYEALGDRARAAENHFNTGALLVNYGEAAKGLQLVRDAFAVFRDAGNRRFQILAAQVTAGYRMQTGAYVEAERELNRARSLANEWDLPGELVAISVRLAQKHLATGDYDAARVLLMQALPNAAGRDRLRAQIYLARANVRLGDFAAAETLLRQVRDGFQTNRDLALRPLISLTTGELEYERGRLHDARAAFDEGAQLVTRELIDDTAVEASAYRGLLEAAHHVDQARRIVNDSLALAQRIGHLSLAARCRVFLARIDVGARRFDEALSTLRDVPRDDESRMIEPEIRAQVLYWSGRARSGKADTRGAEEIEAGRRLIHDVATRIPEGFRSTFLSRASVGEVLR